MAKIEDALKQPKYLESIIKQQETLAKMALPITQHQKMLEAIKPNISLGFNVPAVSFALEDFGSSLAKNIELYKPPVFDIPIAKLGMAAIDHYQGINDNLAKIAESIPKDIILNIGNNFLTTMQKAMENLMLPIYDFIKNLHIDFNVEKFEKGYLKCMFECRWFPYLHEDITLSYMRVIMDAYNRSRSPNALTRKIDKLIFAIFTPQRLVQMKREWNSIETNKTRNRIIRQAIDAHNRKQYALTVFALVPIWEGIIAEKTLQNGRMKSKEVKEHLCDLIKGNELPEIMSSFFNDYIMYQCDSPNDVIDGVPGRHASAHGWMKNYPTRKTSLNAILFTDFLLRLEIIQEDESNGQ